MLFGFLPSLPLFPNRFRLRHCNWKRHRPWNFLRPAWTYFPGSAAECRQARSRPTRWWTCSLVNPIKVICTRNPLSLSRSLALSVEALMKRVVMYPYVLNSWLSLRPPPPRYLRRGTVWSHLAARWLLNTIEFGIPYAKIGASLQIGTRA